MEHASGGSIKNIIDKFQNLEERVTRFYTRQILEGLAYLHSLDLVHRFASININYLSSL